MGIKHKYMFVLSAQSSVDEAEALLKRHEELEARLQAQDERLAAFAQRADALAALTPPHYAKEQYVHVRTHTHTYAHAYTHTNFQYIFFSYVKIPILSHDIACCDIFKTLRIKNQNNTIIAFVAQIHYENEMNECIKRNYDTVGHELHFS